MKGAKSVQSVQNTIQAAQAVVRMMAPPPSSPKLSRDKAKLPAVTSAEGAERRWSTNSNIFWAAAPTADRLPAGLYKPTMSDMGPMLVKILCDTDELIELPDTATLYVLDEIERFWKLEPEFKKRGFLHKRGVLLWGPPGSGKTAAITLLVKAIMDQYEGIALFVGDPELAGACLQMIRHIEPARPIICILEDLDALVTQYRESQYLALLDGESQVDNVAFIATTNYPEVLDRRFTDRPSRFDTIKEIGMPTDIARRAYLKVKEPSLTEPELDQWVKASVGYSVAHLRELIILCKCFQKPLETAVKILDDMRESLPNSGRATDGLGSGIGFMRGKI